jgi:hypothetical protein
LKKVQKYKILHWSRIQFKNLANFSPRRWWIGASDKAQEGNFSWCYPNDAQTFDSVLSVPFAKGEPGLNHDAEDCVELINRGNRLALNDRACDVKNRYICEVNFLIDSYKLGDNVKMI